ncbi:PREDICTED: MAU2 chromatid cohesion factor homolog [Ficedula albicollis]|uniref:MAU2 chromatid cohesion factor homolog n=1 Tax=Ficedula albicollis TaxID=59894 RepID=UPI0007AD930C|nr:PREDICTED: MAU2 chromatid cohesion factor homolog [Ficedula albicollis]
MRGAERWEWEELQDLFLAFADLNKACGNAMDAHEAAQMHQNFSQQLLQDHIEACSLPEHNLITWTDGPPPVQFQAQNGPTTSLASLL